MSKIVRFDVMAVHGARSDRPFTPGMARAALIVGVKNFIALVLLTWSIAQVPHTFVARAARATTGLCEKATPSGRVAVSSTRLSRRRVPDATVADGVRACFPEFSRCTRANMDTSMPARV